MTRGVVCHLGRQKKEEEGEELSIGQKEEE